MIRNPTPNIPNVADEPAQHRRILEQLLAEHRDFLLSTARRLCGPIDSEDLVHDVVEKILRNTNVAPRAGQERAWLAVVLHNQFIDRLRRIKARREDATSDFLEVASVPTERDVWWQHLTEADIRAKLQEVSPELRSAFELFTFERKSYVDIAAALNISKATVGTRILRARLQLRELLGATTTTRGAR